MNQKPDSIIWIYQGVTFPTPNYQLHITEIG